MKAVLSLGFCLMVLNSLAQRTVDVDKESANSNPSYFYTVGGTPFVNAKFVRLTEGTPYFSSDWMKGTITDRKGREYKDVSLKLDLFDNELHYLDKEGNEMIATLPISKIVLQDNDKSYRFLHASIIPASVSGGWYLLLDSGAVSLFKYFNKKLNEFKPYNSATVEQRIETTEKYFILEDGNFKPVKKLKDIPDVLSGKKAELDEFIKSKDKKNNSTDERMKAAIDYYNSLVESK